MKEFSAFVAAKGESPPKAIEEALFQKIHSALNPSLPVALAKFFGFHVLGSFVTLLMCPQFGLSLFDSAGLMPEFLMEIHPGLCFFGCGLMWMVVGQALTYLFFTIDEQRILGAYRPAGIITVLLLSVLLFGCLGSLRLDEWLLFWILGAGAITFAFNWPIERKLRRWKSRPSVMPG